MEFISKIQLSHNGRYIIYENTIYDVSTDTSFDISSTNIDFWLNFLKENSEQSYKNLLTKYSDIQKIIRETVYNVSNIFTGRDKDKFLLEFESKHSNNLLTEELNQDNNISKINSSWNFIIEKVNEFNILKEQEEEQGFLSKMGDKISSGFSWLKEKGIGWFFEQLRTALQSWGGAAVQTFLATFGSAVGGNVILVIVWGTMLAYDIYRGIQGEWDWANLLIDLIAVITTGPGAKVIGKLFTELGIMGKNLPLGKILQRISTSKLGAWFSKVIKLVISGISKIAGYVAQGIKWLGSKLKIKSLDKVSSQITSKLSEITSEIATTASKVSKSVAGKTTQIANKVSKPVAGKISQLSSKVSPKINALKQGVKNLAKTKTGQVGTSVGVTAGFNKLTGSNNKVFGGSFEKSERIPMQDISKMEMDFDINEI
jgi:hypothetical protein